MPALVAAWQAVAKAFDPVAPDVTALLVTAGGAAVVNAVCALLLVRVRHHGGSLSGAAYLSARNDVAINVAIMAMALVTAWTGSGWPDIVLGCVIVVVNSRAALGGVGARRRGATRRPGAGRRGPRRLTGVRPRWCRAASAPRRR